jgi:hypothetical protein
LGHEPIASRQMVIVSDISERSAATAMEKSQERRLKLGRAVDISLDAAVDHLGGFLSCIFLVYQSSDAQLTPVGLCRGGDTGSPNPRAWVRRAWLKGVLDSVQWRCERMEPTSRRRPRFDKGVAGCQARVALERHRRPAELSDMTILAHPTAVTN